MHKPTFETRAFIDSLQRHRDKKLVFESGDRQIQPGYHVTEIKASSFRSLDCGARPQQWNETIVQLWDVADKPEGSHMSVRKFLGIFRKVDESVGLDQNAEVKFEWGDAATPAVFYTFAAMRAEGDQVVVSVEPVRATCKPRDDWWMDESATHAQSAGACCTPAPAGALIQITDLAPVAASACCAAKTGTPCCN